MISRYCRKCLHQFFAGRLIGAVFHIDEAYATQLLEMGQEKAVDDFDDLLWRQLFVG